ncbi:MAG: DUF1559 domain-containing protein [Sedimentisphaerales bacterium]|nr:DUF1559 domain-containing protein [Sedimentisphaerales bacterium]
MRNRRGFTRIDLLAVIFVIVFSFTICIALVPSFDIAEESARRAQCANQLRQMGTAFVVYAASNDGLLPWYGGKDPAYKPPFNCDLGVGIWECPYDGEIHPFLAYRDTYPGVNPDGSLRPFRLACLYEAGIISDPKIFYCPSETNPLYQYNSYTNPALPNTSTEWGTLPQVINNLGYYGNQYVRTGYTYYPTSPGTLIHPVYQAPAYTARRFAELDTALPYLTDFIWKRTEPAGAPIEELRKYPKPFAHRTADGLYAANTLFKDGHVFFCDDQRAFSHDKWEPFEMGMITYQTFFYKTYKIIGSLSRGEEPEYP